MPDRVSQQDIARHLGLSKSAVSQALRGCKCIPEETRKLIAVTAAKMGYKPPALLLEMMGQLRKGHPDNYRGTIAVIIMSDVPLEETIELTPVLRVQLLGIVQKAEELGYGVHKALLSPGMRKASALRRVLRTRGIRGIIIMLEYGLPLPVEYQSLEDQFCCVTMGNHDITWTRGFFVHQDNYHIGVECTRQALYHGYVRPGLALHPMLDPCHRLYAGYLSVLKQASLESIPVVWGTESTINAVKIREWYLHYKPDCVIGNLEFFRYAIEAGGFETPSDFGFIHTSKDDCLDAGAHACFNTCEFESGGFAVEMLISRLQGRTARSGNVDSRFGGIVQGVWQGGPSIRRVTEKIEVFRADEAFVGTDCSQQECLDIGTLFNRSIHGADSWFGAQPLTLIPAGMVEVAGVRLRLPQKTTVASACMLRSTQLLHLGESHWPRQVIVPIRGNVRRVYFLLGCAFAYKQEQVGSIVFTWSDGQTSAVALHARGTRNTDGFTLYDWWDGIQEHRQSCLRIVKVLNLGGSLVYSYHRLNLLEWHNLRPEIPIQEATISVTGTNQAAICLLAVTLQK